jgi:hypothetical protein
MIHRIALAVGACIFALGGASAQDGAAPRFIVHGKDGPLPPAELLKLSPVWTLERAGSKEALKGTDWVGLHREGHSRPAPLTERVVLLSNGDRLPLRRGQPVRLEDGRIVFTPDEPLRPSAGAELSVFAPHVALILVSVPEGVDDAERFLADLQREPRQRDLVLLKNGDRIEGTVTGMGAAEGCEVLADGRKIVTAWSKLAGVAFAASNQTRPRTKKLYTRAVLAGGARAQFGSLAYDSTEKLWTGHTTGGADVTISESGLVALDIMQGKAVYLSDLTPLGNKETPYLGVHWPLGIDSTTDDAPLRVGDDYYDKGLGMHARSSATYWLDGKYSSFEAVVGVDPSAGSKGRARLAVWVDGRRHALGDGKEQTAADAPLTVRLDVRDAKTLMLVVNFGSLGDVQSRVNWGGARLIKSAE